MVRQEEGVRESLFMCMAVGKGHSSCAHCNNKVAICVPWKEFAQGRGKSSLLRKPARASQSYQPVQNGLVCILSFIPWPSPVLPYVCSHNYTREQKSCFCVLANQRTKAGKTLERLRLHEAILCCGRPTTTHYLQPGRRSLY